MKQTTRDVARDVKPVEDNPDKKTNRDKGKQRMEGGREPSQSMDCSFAEIGNKK